MNRSIPILAFLITILIGFESFAQTDTIRIFTLAGCVRCEQTKTFVANHAINAQFYDFSDPAFERNFGALMNKTGFKGNLEFPVVFWNGITYYNIPDLNQFLNSMVEKKPTR